MDSTSRGIVEYGSPATPPMRQGAAQSVALPIPPTRRLGADELFEILRRRKLLIAATVLAALALALVGLARSTPVYMAANTIRVQAEPSEEGDPATAAATALQEELRIASKIELLQSRALARRLAELLNLAQDPEYAVTTEEPGIAGRLLTALLPLRPPPAPAEKADPRDLELDRIADRLRDNVTVERIGKSNLIAVTARSSDPAKAALIANKLVEVHIKGLRDGQKESYEREVGRLAQRVDVARTEMQEADRALAQFRLANGVVLSRPEGLSQSQLAQVSGALSQARGEAAARSVRAGLHAGSAGASASSALMTDLRSQEAGLQKRLAELSTLYGRRHPDVLGTNAQLAEVRARIGEETGRIGAGLRQDASISGAQAGQFAADLGAIRSEGLRQVGTMPALMALEREMETASTVYVTLLSRLKDLSGRGERAASDVNIVSRASVPLEASYPAPKRTLSIAFLGSLALGVVLALIAEGRDNRVRNAEHVDQWLSVPPLAIVPEAQDRTGIALYEHIRSRPRSAFAEAIRSLLVELDLRGPQTGSHVVMLTSPTGGEGKATVAACLAAAAACTCRSVVLVDLDLRNPRLQGRMIAQRGSSDVVDYLAGGLQLSATLAYDPAVAPFATLGVYDPVPDAGSLIGSARLAPLIAELREQFETVVIIAPPILPVRDAKLIARYVDTTLLVLRWGMTSFPLARAAIELLGGNVDGAVLNRAERAEPTNAGRLRGLGGRIRDHDDAAVDALPSEGPRRLRLGRQRHHRAAGA